MYTPNPHHSTGPISSAPSTVYQTSMLTQQQLATGGQPQPLDIMSQQQQHQGSGNAPEFETVYLYIPNVAVGAIIGTKGSYIKNIIKLSGASVKITPMTPEESKQALERQVVVVGTPEAQWKAQYYIYEKIRQERFTNDENVKLRAELRVPAQIVGRIIGKSGKNVRELQRSTGATIKLPEDIAGAHQVAVGGQQASEPTSAEQSSNANTSESTAVKEEEEGAVPVPVQAEVSAVAAESAANAEASAATEAEPVLSEEQQSAKTEETIKSEAETAVAETTGESAALNKSSSSDVDKDYVVVRIFGTFQASQCAQRRIQSLVNGPAQQQRGGNIAASYNGNFSMHQIAPMPISMNAATGGHYQNERYGGVQGGHHQHVGPQQHMHNKTNGYVPRRNQRQFYPNSNGKQQSHQPQEANGQVMSNSNSSSAATIVTNNTPAVNGTAENIGNASASSPSTAQHQQQPQEQSPSVSSSTAQQQQPQTVAANWMRSNWKMLVFLFYFKKCQPSPNIKFIFTKQTNKQTNLVYCLFF